MISVSKHAFGGLIGRDRNGLVLAIVHVDHLTSEQREDLALIYRALAAQIQPAKEDS